MSGRGRGIKPAIWVLWGLSLVLIGPAWAAQDAALEERRQSLEELRRDLDQAKQRKKAVAQKEHSLLGQLERFDRQLQVSRREKEQIERNVVRVDNEIQGLEVQIASLKEFTRDRKDWVGVQIREMYKQGRFPYLRLLINSQGYHDFLKQSVYLDHVVRQEADILRMYEDNARLLERKEEALKGKKDELLTYRGQMEKKLVEVQTQKRQKNRLLASVRGEKSAQERMIREMEDSSRKLQALIRKLEDERLRAARSKGRRGTPPGLDFGQVRGRLNWPADGVLVSQFGRQKHPRFDTIVDKKGIEIGDLRRPEVRSVYGGQVAYADWFPGYGMVIILDHGENYYTLYAHLARLYVSAGDAVVQDQVIGEVGDTGVSQGNRLYFELRRGEKPVNPLAWLKSKP